MNLKHCLRNNFSAELTSVIVGLGRSDDGDCSIADSIGCRLQVLDLLHESRRQFRRIGTRQVLQQNLQLTCKQNTMEKRIWLRK